MDQDICWDNVDVLAHSDAEPDAKANLSGRIEHVTFGEKIYIPKRSYLKYVKPWHIVASISVIVLIIIILVVSIKGKSAAEQNDPWNNFRSGLMIIHNNSILGYDTELNKIVSLLKIDDFIGGFDISLNKTILWNGANKSRIMSLKKNAQWNTDKKSNSTTFFDDPRFNPQAMAVDTFTEKLYVIDKIMGSLIIIDMKTKQYGVALTDLKEPHDILLDSEHGIMFILQLSHSILKANMDGSSLIKMTDHGNFNAFALDRKGEKIYWVKDFFKIERSDYTGYRRETILTDHVKIISLAFFNNYLYYLWPADGPHNATLWSCRFLNDTCKTHRMEKVDLHNATHIKAHFELKKNVSENTCMLRNGGCQQMCLLAPGSNAGRSCACQVGMEFGSDLRTCRNVSTFILYTLGNYARGRILDESRIPFSDVFLPTQFQTKALSYKNTIDFEYDIGNDDFYFSDDLHIYKMPLKRPGSQTIVQSCLDSHVIEDLAFDWLSGNMYYSSRSKTPEALHALVMFNVKHPKAYQRTLSSYMYRTGFGLNACPYALAVYPSKGLLFYSAGDGSVRSIYRTTLNGTRLSMTTSNIEFLHENRLLAIDYEKDRLYWIHRNSYETEIRHTNFNGSGEELIHVKNLRDTRTIFLDHQWMYLSTGTSIWRVHKDLVGPVSRIAPKLGVDVIQPVAGVRVMNSSLQMSNVENPCAVNNGGCEQFCYAAPKKTCDCMDNENVQPNGSCL